MTDERTGYISPIPRRLSFFILHPSSFILSEEDVARLDVAVDDAATMRRHHSLARGDQDRRRVPPRQTAIPHEGLSGPGLHQFHDQIPTAGVGAGVVDRDDVWMSQRAENSGLTIDLFYISSASEFVGYKFDGDSLPKPRIVRFTHYPRTAAAEWA